MTTLSRVEAVEELRHIQRKGFGQLYMHGENYITYDRHENKFFFVEHIDPENSEAYLETELTSKNILAIIKKNFDRIPIVYVNAYAVHRCYGGPEEGGWWYDAYEALVSVPILKKNDNVRRVIEMLEESLGPQYEQPHGRNRYSVIGGPDLKICVEDHPAESTKEKPHYE